MAPPHIHRRNAAKRAIQTVKHHFLAGLASCNKNFPLQEWDRLTYQAQLTLNLLRNSRVMLQLSAYSYLHGVYDFNQCPLAPPGVQVIAHTKNKVLSVWGFHSQDGWTIGPSPNHYRCIKCFLPAS